MSDHENEEGVGKLVEVTPEPTPRREMTIAEKQEFAINRVTGLIETLNGWIIESKNIGLTLGIEVQEVTLDDPNLKGTFNFVMITSTLREIPHDV